MRLKDRLMAHTVLVAALVLALMSTAATQASFYRALGAEAEHMANRLDDVAKGIKAAYVGYAMEGRTMEEAQLRDIAAQYGAALDRVAARTGAQMTRRGTWMEAKYGLSIGDGDYEITLICDLEEIFAANHRLIARCALISALGLMVFLGFMGGVANRLLRPLEALTRASNALAGGDMQARVTVDTRDEIGELARQMNDMAEALEEAMARRDQLIANLTHEMKTPLAAVMGHADLIRRGCDEGETLTHAHIIYKEAARLDALSRRMMHWVVMQRDEVEARCLSASVLVRDVQAAFATRAKIAIAAEEGWVCADKALMETLLSNLVENSLHAGARNVTLAARREAGRVEFSVSDDGCGMEEAALKRVEEPFYRVDRARSRAHGGAGLGLSLCRRIVEAHGGQMRIESAPGAGTTVTVALKEGENEEKE